MRKSILIGYASGWGAQIRETELGSNKLKHLLKDKYKINTIIYPKYSAKQYNISNPIDAFSIIYNHINRLANRVKNVCEHGKFPVIIGGGHTSAMGTWSGVTTALNAEGNFGLIWLDAHMDAHTEDTSPSGAYHGMPVASLLGEGNKKLASFINSKAKISPQHVCLIGVRSYEKGEADLLKKLGVKVYLIDEVKKRGFKKVYKEALKIARNAKKGYGISIDLDAFDPQEAPGVGSREKDGLKKQEVLPVLKEFANDEKLKALEIAEYNPLRDNKNKTALLVNDILDIFL